MKIKLDKEIECLINQSYSIDTSIFEDIERRRQQANNAISIANDIVAQSPQPIPEPEITDSEFKNIENKIRYEQRLKERELESVKASLSVLDVNIDKIDELIIQIDRKANLLINEINDSINDVKDAYNDRINAGCRNNLRWQFIGTSIAGYSDYIAIKSPDLEKRENYYGIKYYQKPSNRDYGFSIIKEFNGSIEINSKSLGIISGNISNINVGDEITDSLTGVSSLYISEIPKVVGFGTTNAIGIQTTIYGTVSLGSSVIAVTGIGSTSNTSIGYYVLYPGVFDSNTKIIGFGSTIVPISYYDVNTSSMATQNTTVPSILLSKVAITTITNQPIGFGSETIVPSIELDKSSISTLQNKKFTVIRNIEDSDSDFEFTKSPIDPVTIGIIDDDILGVGNKVEFINNGEDEGPFTWREVTLEEEPDCGNGVAIGYTGDTSWPYEDNLVSYLGGIIGYATEGIIYKFNSTVPPGITSTPPGGINLNGATCTELNTKITQAEAKLEQVKNKNLSEIQKLVSYSSVFRNIRNKYEIQAWSYLQSISYLNNELNGLNSELISIDNIDESIFNE